MKLSPTTDIKSRFILTLKRAGWVLYLVTSVSIFFEQFLSKWVEREFMSHEGASNSVWVVLGIYVILSLLTPIAIGLLVVASISTHSIIEIIKKSWQQLIIENLRTAGKTILWSCLLILPGIVRLIQLSFVQFIVLLDSNYDQGKVDALKRSTHLVNQRFFRVLGVLTLFTFVLPLLIAGFDDYTRFEHYPLSALLFAGIQTIIFILGTLTLLKQWEKAHGTYV